MELTPMSFALLGLLSVRPWTTYELANQTKRSLRFFFFPRAERHLDAEARRLADAGLARSEQAFTGRRRSTTYAITPAGRKALQQWLRTEPAPSPTSIACSRTGPTGQARRSRRREHPDGRDWDGALAVMAHIAQAGEEAGP